MSTAEAVSTVVAARADWIVDQLGDLAESVVGTLGATTARSTVTDPSTGSTAEITPAGSR